MTNVLHKTSGAVALISILVIAAFTLLLVIGMSEINISTSYQFLNQNSNKIAYYTAEACLEEALIRLENDPGFTSTTIVMDSDTSCTVTLSGGADITISVNYLQYIQNFTAQISISVLGEARNIQLLNWREI